MLRRSLPRTVMGKLYRLCPHPKTMSNRLKTITRIVSTVILMSSERQSGTSTLGPSVQLRTHLGSPYHTGAGEKFLSRMRRDDVWHRALWRRRSHEFRWEHRHAWAARST